MIGNKKVVVFKSVFSMIWVHCYDSFFPAISLTKQSLLVLFWPRTAQLSPNNLLMSCTLTYLCSFHTNYCQYVWGGGDAEGENEVFNHSESSIPSLSGAFYRTQISSFVAEIWSREVGRVSEIYRNLYRILKCQNFQLKNYEKELLEASRSVGKLKMGMGLVKSVI